MKLRSSVPLVSVVVAFGLTLVHGRPAAAQASQTLIAGQSLSAWENDRLRVRPISVAPGAALPAAAGGDAVLVLLTADWEGRMPAAEATWQPAGGSELQNRGRAPVEGLLIELKDVPASGPAATPPEAIPVTGEIDVRSLIDNPRVSVTRQRYARGAYASTTWHFHPHDALIVYLTGGDAWRPYGGRGAARIRRGEVDILPANTLHSFGNPGNDPLEFLVIFPK